MFNVKKIIGFKSIHTKNNLKTNTFNSFFNKKHKKN